MRIVFPAPKYQDLRYTFVTAPGVESAGIAFTVPASIGNPDGNDQRWLVKETWVPQDVSYLVRTRTRISLRPEFVINALIHAQETGMGVMFIHTHPQDSFPTFSSIDDEGEVNLRTLFEERAPGRPHFAMVVGHEGAQARRLGYPDLVDVRVLGRRLETITDRGFAKGDVDERYARQVAILSQKGQERLGKIRVAIVGFGGTGSVAAQQLAYLGIRDYLLIDTDRIEKTNLNRVVGATPSDIGRLKVEVARDHIMKILPEAAVRIETDDVCEENVVNMLTTVDAIMLCTDSHGSRAVVNKLAYQYLIPTINVGAYIDVTPMGEARLRGRVQLLAPGQACLLCHGLLDSDRVRFELQSDAERKRDPYGLPQGTTQPAAISINSVVASFAVTMLLQVMTQLDGDVRSLSYDGVDARVRELVAKCAPRCPDCADKYVAAGDTERLYYRSRAT